VQFEFYKDRASQIFRMIDVCSQNNYGHFNFTYLALYWYVSVTHMGTFCGQSAAKTWFKANSFVNISFSNFGYKSIKVIARPCGRPAR